MVSLGYSQKYRECYRIDFDNGNWIEIPFNHAASFLSNLRDVGIRAKEVLDEDIHGYEMEKTFGYGTISWDGSYRLRANHIGIHCKDGHWADIHVKEAMELVKLLRDQGF